MTRAHGGRGAIAVCPAAAGMLASSLWTPPEPLADAETTCAPPLPEGAAPAVAAAPAAAPASSSPPWPVLLRRVLELAAPTTLLALIQTTCQLVEPWLAARQGTAALAGWAVVLPFALLLQQMSVGAMGGGVVSAIARAIGGGRPAEASALVLHALVIATGFGLAFAVLLAGFPRAVLGAVGGAEAAEAAAGTPLGSSARGRSRLGWRTPWPPCCAAAGGTRWRRARCWWLGSPSRRSPGR